LEPQQSDYLPQQGFCNYTGWTYYAYVEFGAKDKIEIDKHTHTHTHTRTQSHTHE